MMSSSLGVSEVSEGGDEDMLLVVFGEVCAVGGTMVSVRCQADVLNDGSRMRLLPGGRVSHTTRQKAVVVGCWENLWAWDPGIRYLFTCTRLQSHTTQSAQNPKCDWTPHRRKWKQLPL